MLQHHSRQVEVQGAPNIRGAVCAIHIFQHVVDGDHVMTWQAAREPEQMRNMHKVATQAAEHGAALHVSAKRISGRQGNSLEIVRQLANLGDFFGGPEKEIFVFVVPPRQGADYVSGIGANTEFVDPANIEGNPHKEIVTTVSGTAISAKSLIRVIPRRRAGEQQCQASISNQSGALFLCPRCGWRGESSQTPRRNLLNQPVGTRASSALLSMM